MPIDVHQVDLIDFESVLPFDLICTHGFLGWFAAEDRRTIVATWRRLLRPGGVALTASSLRGRIGLTDGEATSFHTRGRLAHAEGKRRFGLDAETIDRWTERYANRTTHYMNVSVADVQRMFVEEGFTFRELVTVPARRPVDLDRIRLLVERAR